MNGTRLVAIGLIVLGALALAYGSFSYTKQTQEAKLGPFELTVKDKQTVNIPGWVGGGAIALGLVLLVTSRVKT